MEEDRIARVSIRRSKDASNSLSTADSRHGRSHCKLDATRAVSTCTSARHEHVSRSRSNVERLCPRVPRLTRARICRSIENNNNLPPRPRALGPRGHISSKIDPKQTVISFIFLKTICGTKKVLKTATSFAREKLDQDHLKKKEIPPSLGAAPPRGTTARPPRSARRRRQRAERASSHSPREHGDRRRRLERHARAARRKRQGSLRGRRRGGGGDGAGRRWRRVVRLQRAGACSEPSSSISALSAERTCGTRAETMRPGSHLGALLDRARGDAEPRRRRRNTRRFFCSSTIHPTVRLVRLRDAPCARAIRLTLCLPTRPRFVPS